MTIIIVAILIYFISMNRSNLIIQNVTKENTELKKEIENSRQEMYDLANDFLVVKEEMQREIDNLSK